MMHYVFLGHGSPGCIVSQRGTRSRPKNQVLYRLLLFANGQHGITHVLIWLIVFIGCDHTRVVRGIVGGIPPWCTQSLQSLCALPEGRRTRHGDCAESACLYQSACRILVCIRSCRIRPYRCRRELVPLGHLQF